MYKDVDNNIKFQYKENNLSNLVNIVDIDIQKMFRNKNQSLRIRDTNLQSIN